MVADDSSRIKGALAIIGKLMLADERYRELLRTRISQDPDLENDIGGQANSPPPEDDGFIAVHPEIETKEEM